MTSLQTFRASSKFLLVVGSSYIHCTLGPVKIEWLGIEGSEPLARVRLWKNVANLNLGDEIIESPVYSFVGPLDTHGGHLVPNCASAFSETAKILLSPINEVMNAGAPFVHQEILQLPDHLPCRRFLEVLSGFGIYEKNRKLWFATKPEDLDPLLGSEWDVWNLDSEFTVVTFLTVKQLTKKKVKLTFKIAWMKEEFISATYREKTRHLFHC